MLLHLSIRNIVIIDSCDIDFNKGLCVLTGETGAGKSILLDALGLALGMRAEKGMVRAGENQGQVTAEFDISKNAEARMVLAALDLPETDTIVIRRSVSIDGRTRCLINDESVSVAGLRKIGETLVEIHGQHDQRGLMDSATHLDLLDAYGNCQRERKETATAFECWRSIRNQIAETIQSLQAAQRERDYLEHMHHELSQLAPEVGEETNLAEARATMMQGEKLAGTIHNALQEIQGTRAVSSSIRSAQRLLTRSAAAERFMPVVDMLERAASEADEAIAALEKLGHDMSYNPARLEQTEERLFALRAAGRKYNMPVDALAELRDETAAKLSAIRHQQDILSSLEAEATKARDAYVNKAGVLSTKREKQAKLCESAVKKELIPLKMSTTKFRVLLTPLSEAEWSARGMETAKFEVATNAGSEFAPLSKIASGGELSRFMLAMKVVMADVKSTPTLIFDEIDTGTGGAVADAIGQRLAMLGKDWQVLVVTHLPQVAAKGNEHLRVSKTEKKSATFTRVDALTSRDRREELARMLSGATITAEARKAADKLLENI